MTTVAKRKSKLILLIAAAVVVAGGSTAYWWQATWLPRRFAPVVDGKLYRSGDVTPAQLEHAQTEFGIRRVISLLNPTAPQSVAERAAAERLGIQWENVPLHGDGRSTPEERQRILALLEEPNAPPTLVHCSAGANRTGLAIGLYRIHDQGWTYEQVLDEMRRHHFEDLPKHENLRQALAQEAAACHATTQPAAAQQELRSPAATP